MHLIINTLKLSFSVFIQAEQLQYAALDAYASLVAFNELRLLKKNVIPPCVNKSNAKFGKNEQVELISETGGNIVAIAELQRTRYVGSNKADDHLVNVKIVVVKSASYLHKVYSINNNNKNDQKNIVKLATGSVYVWRFCRMQRPMKPHTIRIVDGARAQEENASPLLKEIQNIRDEYAGKALSVTRAADDSRAIDEGDGVVVEDDRDMSFESEWDKWEYDSDEEDEMSNDHADVKTTTDRVNALIDKLYAQEHQPRIRGDAFHAMHRMKLAKHVARQKFYRLYRDAIFTWNQDDMLQVKKVLLKKGISFRDTYTKNISYIKKRVRRCILPGPIVHAKVWIVMHLWSLNCHCSVSIPYLLIGNRVAFNSTYGMCVLCPHTVVSIPCMYPFPSHIDRTNTSMDI